jgi:DNA polymerase III alpha subunit
MRTDPIGIPIVAEKDVIELMYQCRAYGDLFTEDISLVDKLEAANQYLSMPLSFRLNIHKTKSVDDMTDRWHMPAEYAEIDIDSWFANKIGTIEQAERVADELALYREGGLYPLLRFLIYIVDLMREHRIVWGVGRGSSVSSYCLFLIGIHKVDSMKFNLDIKEFLK